VDKCDKRQASEQRGQSNIPYPHTGQSRNSTRQPDYNAGQVSYQEFMNSTHKPLDVKLKTLNDNNGYTDGGYKREHKERIELPMKSYDEHYFQNPDTNNYECKLCSRIFNTKTDCQEHIAGQHFPEYVACPFCQKKYCHGQSLRQHVTQVHKQIIKP